MGTDDTDQRAAFAWGPTIDEEACNGCRTCIDFCHKGVFEERDGKVRVVAMTNSVPGCSHCATLCEQGAISFPTIEDIRRWRAQTGKSSGVAPSTTDSPEEDSSRQGSSSALKR